MWVVFVGEQVWQIGGEAPVGSADPSMGIVPSTGRRISRSFLEEDCPSLVPANQSMSQGLFIGPRKGSHDCGEFLSSQQEGMARQIPPDNRRLMEVAHLDRIAGCQGRFDASAAITHTTAWIVQLVRSR